MPSIAIIGRGRMGSALAAALRESGAEVRGPFGRGETSAGARRSCCSAFPIARSPRPRRRSRRGPIVGHVSASAPLDLLAPHERFSMHPLLSVVGAGAQFAGAYCAIDGSSAAALDAARALAESARHARAGSCRASSARSTTPPPRSPRTSSSRSRARPSGSATLVGLERDALVPLVRATVDNWARQGARAALTGPIARGDVATAARQREAVAESAPDLLPALGRARRGDARARRRAGHGRRVKIVRTVAELRDAVRSARAARSAHRPRADDGRVPRRTSRAHAARARAVGLRRRLALRQPDAVQRSRPT